MEWLLYLLVRGGVALVQCLPLSCVARLGRAGGALAYLLDARHRRMARRNLQMCFEGDHSRSEIQSLARENFRRIGESFACAAKTAAMSFDELRPHMEFVGPPELLSPARPKRVVMAIGHFGNFELYARISQFAPAYRCATTYRGLRQQSLNRLLQTLRGGSGCLYFERRSEGRALKNFMKETGVMLGLLCDQHAGDAGLRLPFLGHDCSTSSAPAVLSLRYECELRTAVCYRVGLARWRVEAGEEIQLRQDGEARTTEAIMLDVNRAFEAAIRRDPANWFWVHNRWKPPPPGRGRAVQPAVPNAASARPAG